MHASIFSCNNHKKERCREEHNFSVMLLASAVEEEVESSEETEEGFSFSDGSVQNAYGFFKELEEMVSENFHGGEIEMPPVANTYIYIKCSHGYKTSKKCTMVTVNVSSLLLRVVRMKSG